MKRRILPFVAAALACSTSLALAETTWNRTGAYGGSASGTVDCTRNGTGVATCQGQSAYVAPDGRIYTRQSRRTATATGGTVEATTTWPNGRTSNTTRAWNR
jgi:hypothetical protein